MRPQSVAIYVDGAGRLTAEGLTLLRGMALEIEALQAKLAAIAAVASPSGGATVDAQARAAIGAIIAGAA